MIVAIKEIGEYAIKEEGKDVNNPVAILLDVPSKVKNILFIRLKRENDSLSYDGIEAEEYSAENLEKYLYKKDSANGPDFAPTAIITNVEKTFPNKLIGWFKRYSKIEADFLKPIQKCLEDNQNTIMRELSEKVSFMSSKGENILVSLKIDDNYIGDFQIFRDNLVEQSKKRFYSGSNGISKSEEKICSVCHQRKEEVFGFVGTFKFYTVDKPGFVSGGFHQQDAWKNYPVCLDCALKLEAGKKYLRENMNFNFYGFKYLLIPNFLGKTSEETKREVLKIFKLQGDPEFKSKIVNHLTDDENEVLELMSEQKSYLNLDFMFYDAPRGFDGAVFNILLYVEDILPSRLKELFKVKKKVDTIDIFKECMVSTFENKKRTGEKPLEFNFGILRTFFPKVSNNRTYNKYFLDVVNKIFKGKPVNYNFLMSFIIRKIREPFVDPEKWFGAKNQNMREFTLKGFMLLNYLNALEILKKQKEMKRLSKEEKEKKGILSGSTKISRRIDDFFEEFKDFFDDDTKKAIFLEGALAQILLKIQYQQRGATPFRIKLKGLKLDEKQIKRLLPEIQNKLDEYGRNYYQDLETMISEYFIKTGRDWKLSNDEISFYFVLGMNLSSLFKTGKGENSGGEESE